MWSGRLDSNQRPPAPKAGALPGYATPRPSLEASTCAVATVLALNDMPASAACGSIPGRGAELPGDRFAGICRTEMRHLGRTSDPLFSLCAEATRRRHCRRLAVRAPHMITQPRSCGSRTACDRGATGSVPIAPRPSWLVRCRCRSPSGPQVETLLAGRSRERPVVLLDRGAEAGRHFVRPGQRQRLV